MSQPRQEIQGVDVAMGDSVSDLFYGVITQTSQNRPGLVIDADGTFSGFRAMSGSMFDGVDREKLLVYMGSDGVGTKIEFAERNDDHTSVGHDLTVMVTDDASIRGIEPIAMTTILDTNRLRDTPYFRRTIGQLCDGNISAANEANIVVINGETAELGDRVGGYNPNETDVTWQSVLRGVIRSLSGKERPEKQEYLNYNWGGTLFGLGHADRIITGHDMRAGDVAIGFAEPGFRSNGISDVRRSLLKEHGRKWHEAVVPQLGDQAIGRIVARPSTSYTRLMTALTGGYHPVQEPLAELTGAAHITGGGQFGKIGRMLKPSGLGLAISEPLRVPDALRYVQGLTGFDDVKAYSTWCMGMGMVVTARPSQASKIVTTALEHGIEAQAIGRVTPHAGIRIKRHGTMKVEWMEK